MTAKEQKSFAQQLMYCYSTNRSAPKPVRLVYTGVTEGSLTRERLRTRARSPAPLWARVDAAKPVQNTRRVSSFASFAMCAVGFLPQDRRSGSAAEP